MIMWRAFWRGVCNTFGIAPTRRHVPTPAEEVEAARAEVRAAIRAADERYRNGNPDSAEIDLTQGVIGTQRRKT
jgi:hypothetical protein